LFLETQTSCLHGTTERYFIAADEMPAFLHNTNLLPFNVTTQPAQPFGEGIAYRWIIDVNNSLQNSETVRMFY
jgi:hypothetical protein